EPSSRERLAVLHIGHEGGDEGWTGHAQSKRFPLVRFLPVRVLVGRLLEQALELKEQGGCTQLIVGQILGLRAPQGERQRGRGLVSGVVEVVLRVTERMRSDGKRDLVPDRRGPFVPGLVSSGPRQSRDDDECHNPWGQDDHHHSFFRPILRRLTTPWTPSVCFETLVGFFRTWELMTV